MKPVMQTQFVDEHGKGNCLAACVASIFEIDINDVPDLDRGGNWKNLVDFCEQWNVVPVWLHCKDLCKSWVGYPKGHVIVTGDSPRHNTGHAVVAEHKGYGYEIVHDPHPDATGIKGDIKTVIYFVVKDPLLQRRLAQDEQRD